MRLLLIASILSLGCTTTPEPPTAPALLYPSCGRSALYQVTEIHLAETQDEVRLQSLDIDGDDVADNRLGSWRVSIESILEESSDWPQRAIESGDLQWLIDIEECVDQDGTAYRRVASHRGSSDGIEASGGMPAIALDARGARDGNALMPLSAFAELPGSPLGPVAWARGAGFAAALEVDGQTLSGTLAAGFRPPDVRDVVLPGLASSLTRVLEETEGCPEACPDGSYGALVVNFFDSNKDGRVELAELEDNAIVDGLSQPDLDLVSPFDGQATYWPLHDLESDHISFGVAVVAERIVQ